MEILTGSSSWRLFDWGVVRGDVLVTGFSERLSSIFDLQLKTANRFDVTNPSPSRVFVLLLLLASASYRFIRLPRVIKEETVNPPPQTPEPLPIARENNIPQPAIGVALADEDKDHAQTLNVARALDALDKHRTD